jgi:hypothetical protein
MTWLPNQLDHQHVGAVHLPAPTNLTPILTFEGSPCKACGALPDYAELQCASNFSFLHGASHAEDLAARAAQLGYAALVVTNPASLRGVDQRGRNDSRANCGRSRRSRVAYRLNRPVKA